MDIVFQKQRLRISLNMKFSEVIDPNGICRDITGIGRWGNGDVELYMEHTSDVDQVMEFLELFLRNLLLNENHPLHNRTLHISVTCKALEKVNIENEKVNIQNSFSAKTASHVCKLLDKFRFQTIFGRSDVQEILGLKPTRSTALLKEMAEKGFVESVTGRGKGKYRFVQH